MMGGMTITEFLLARIAEQAAAARVSKDAPWMVAHAQDCDWPGDMPGYCDCGAEDRALADCNAKRRIVDSLRHTDAEHWAYDTLLNLAAVYADHPDYDESWRP